MKLLNNSHYFDGSVSHGFVSLYSSKSIVSIAGGLLGIFLPIFLYELFDKNFQYVASYYLIGNLSFAATIAIGTKFLNKFGFRKALRVSAFLGAAFYACFYFTNENNWQYFIPLSIVVLLLFRIAYWIPYHVDFAKFTSKTNRSRQVGLLEATNNVVGIFTPFIAGFILSRYGFNILFMVAVILYCASFIPYITIPRTKEKFDWDYLETWKKFFAKERRDVVYAFMADGAESVVGLIVWPVFIFNVLKGNYFEVGAVSALIVGVTILLQLLVGEYADKKVGKKIIIQFGSILYSLGWILKIFVATAFHIFIIDSYHKLMKIFLRIPFDALTYEIAASKGHYVDEFSVVHEIAINIGKSIMLIVVIVALVFIPLQWTFVLAAVASILFNFLRAKQALAQ